MERILITGGAGFIGANLAASLIKQGNCDVVIADNFSSGDWRNLVNVDCEVRACDCDDVGLLDEIAAGHFTAVLHQGAISDTTVMDQRLMLEVNTNAFAAILAAAAQSKTRVVYASSAGVYGNSPAPNAVGCGEQPANIYGFSKLSMDRVASRCYGKSPAPIIGLRYFNVYGPGEAHKNNTSSMMLQLYQQLLQGKKPRLFEHGEQRRDFVYIRDVIAANQAALRGTLSGVCNVGSGHARSFNDVINTLAKILEIEVDVEYIHNPYDFYQNHTEANLDDTCRLLDWSPEWSLEKGMREYIELLKSGHHGPVESVI
ncbi:MAG: ADP-glyceromanno-heptose 6-epimerase [Mariprofundaceae bacterium]